MAERYPEAELVLDDELLYDDAPRRPLLRRDERPEDIVREGEVLAGKYRVERIPGRNGLGVLVQVRHLELGQEVTLKFLVPEACAYPEFVQRFVREARAAVKIQGEHVARVTDVGRLESGAPYMVREYLRGPDLAEVLKVRGPLPTEEAVDYIVQAGEGVAEGHALGVVHRNLRPTSLVVARRSDGTPLVKVFDFAASESLHVNPFTERAVSLVGTSAIMASLPYLAPEQIRDPHDVDFRADVYALGAILFELLTGTPVYAAEAAPALLAQVAADAAPSLRSLRPDAPGELDHIVLRCLAKNRAIRYPSIAELVLALRPFASLETANSIERIVRLAKRTSKLPDSESRIPSPLPPAPSPSLAPSQPARGRHGTVLVHNAEPVSSQSVPAARGSVHEDVTAINPYASYGAPVVIHPPPARAEAPGDARSEAPRTEPFRPEPARTHTQRIEVPRIEPWRRTPQPPPIRSSAPPPLRESAAIPAPLPLPASVAPAPDAPAGPQDDGRGGRTDTASLPPAPRTSISGLSRSWAVQEETAPPLFTQRRLVALGGIAAGAALALVLALRTTHPAASVPPVAAVASPPAAPARIEPPPPVAPAPVEAPAAAPSVAAPTPSAPVAASAAASPVATPPAPTPPAPPPAPMATAPVAARPAPAPVAAAPAVKPVARPAASPRRASPADEAASSETTRKAVAVAEPRAAAPRVSGADLFDAPR